MGSLQELIDMLELMATQGTRYGSAVYYMERAADNLRCQGELLDDLLSAPSCNTCKRKGCTYRPRPGQMNRFNCPLWKGDGLNG